jgi:hypothetical protein
LLETKSGGQGDTRRFSKLFFFWKSPRNQRSYSTNSNLKGCIKTGANQLQDRKAGVVYIQKLISESKRKRKAIPVTDRGSP